MHFNIISIFILASLLLSGTAFYANQSSDYIAPQIPVHIRKNLIDLHTHVACESKDNGCYINPRFKKHWKYNIYLRAFGVSKKEFETQGDDIIPQKLSEIIHQSQFVNKAVVLGLDGFYNSDGILNLEKTQILVSNSFLLQQTQKYANLLYGPSIHPLRKDALSELEKAKSDGAVLIKWLPCIMGIDPSSKDPRITAFYRKLIELNIPLLSHTGDEHSFMDADNVFCDPEKLKRPLSMGVKVIAAHLGTLGKFQGEPGISRMNKMMNEFPKLKFDISSLVNINKFNHIKYAHDYPGRYYYGSDYPLIRAQFLGLPLSSHIYYKLKITKEWSQFIDSFKNVFDQDVALKMALGVPLHELEKTIE